MFYIDWAEMDPLLHEPLFAWPLSRINPKLVFLYYVLHDPEHDSYITVGNSHSHSINPTKRCAAAQKKEILTLLRVLNSLNLINLNLLRFLTGSAILVQE